MLRLLFIFILFSAAGHTRSLSQVSASGESFTGQTTIISGATDTRGGNKHVHAPAKPLTSKKKKRTRGTGPSLFYLPSGETTTVNTIRSKLVFFKDEVYAFRFFFSYKKRGPPLSE